MCCLFGMIDCHGRFSAREILRQYAPWLQVREMTNLLRNESLLCMDESGKSTKKFNGRRYLHLKL